MRHAGRGSLMVAMLPCEPTARSRSPAHLSGEMLPRVTLNAPVEFAVTRTDLPVFDVIVTRSWATKCLPRRTIGLVP